MTSQPVALSYSAILSQVPSEWHGRPLREEIVQIQRNRNRKIIVLDDDPTGVQTVHDIYVLTDWSLTLLQEAFARPDPMFYILTNTRAYAADVVERINREIVQNVLQLSRQTGIDFVFVSRSDSTLRGHYPLEIDTLTDERVIGTTFDGHILIPAFFEGGRLTVGNTHYVHEHDDLIPVNETEFAADKVFGYGNSDLTRWVEEKTNGRRRASDCVCISIEDIRRGPDVVEQVLLTVTGNAPVVVNCLSYADMDVLSLALLQAEARGKKFIFRTAASFVKSYAGIDTTDYLARDRLVTRGHEGNGGLVVVGSHVEKTSRQLANLLQHTHVVPLELDVGMVLNPTRRSDELRRLTTEVNRRLVQGENVVVFSSRELVAADNPSANLDISHTVSMALVQVVQSLQVTPKFLIAKGGITSSDVATKGLGIRQARVIGQAAAGVPVWLTGAEAKFSGIPFIVFPGNVGSDHTLLEIVQRIESSNLP